MINTTRYEVAPTAVQHFIKSLDSCTCNIEYDAERNIFIIDVSRETSYLEQQMEILSRIRGDYAPDSDEYNALNEGISALKTLNDMEVNK